MPQKTITIEHPEAHQAPPGALEEAAKKEGVPDGYETSSIINVSGDRTKWVLTWEDPEPAKTERGSEKAVKA
jgi:hypothetical protein